MENPYLSSPGDGENLFNATTMHDTQSWGWSDIIAPGPSFQFNSSLNEFMSPIFKWLVFHIFSFAKFNYAIRTTQYIRPANNKDNIIATASWHNAAARQIN
jgi:hypothetical protein